MAPDGGAKLAHSFDEAHDPALPVFAALAKELGVWLLIGSRWRSRSAIPRPPTAPSCLRPTGASPRATARSICSMWSWLRARVYRESNTVAGGDEAVVADTALGPIGLTHLL